MRQFLRRLKATVPLANSFMEKSIFLDLDNTLVYQVPWVQSTQFETLAKESPKSGLSKKGLEEVKKLLKEPDVCVMLGSIVMVVTPRPGVYEFLKELRARTENLYIMTKGTVNHQSNVIQAAKLTDYFSGIFGRNSKLHPNMPLSVLVDNNSPRDKTTVWKMSLLGMINSERPGTMEYSELVKAKYVQVSSFQNKSNDDPITAYLDEVLAKFNGLSAYAVSNWLKKSIKNT